MTTKLAEKDIQRSGLATVDQVAEFLAISRTKVYGLMEAGELAYCKIGKSRRVPWEEAKKLIGTTLIRR